MLQVDLNEPFVARAEGAPADLVGQLEVGIFDAENEAISATTVITEQADADGQPLYFADLVAPDVSGYYTVAWRYPDPDVPDGFIESDSEELIVGLAPVVGWAPSREEVGAFLRARTKIPGGDEIGTFNELTRPTGNEVDRIIGQAVRRVTSAIGIAPCNENLRDDARAVTAIRAAMIIEQSYWPEQTRDAGSSFQSLLSLWREDMSVLTEAVSEQCGGGDNGESVGGTALLGAATFDDLPLIGRASPEEW